MKQNMHISHFLVLFPIVLTVILLFFLPEQIPAHYNIHGLADRWGSKYELLILPAINLLMGIFFRFMGRLLARQEASGNNNERVFKLTAHITLAIFSLMTCYFLYLAYYQVEELSKTPIDLNQIIYGALGIALILIGNLMPRLRMNSTIGLRTPWSMKNELTWKKCQHFGGISFLLAGILILLCAFLTRGLLCALFAGIILLLTVIVDIVYSALAARKY